MPVISFQGGILSGSFLCPSDELFLEYIIQSRIFQWVGIVSAAGPGRLSSASRERVESLPFNRFQGNPRSLNNLIVMRI